MIRYSLGRALRAVFTIWGVVTVVFIIPRLVGDPAFAMAPLGSDMEAIESIRVTLGLDKPLIVQYGIYWKDAFQGDLGESYLFRTSALGVVLNRFPATLQLASYGMLWALLFALPLGILAAIRKGSIIDQFTRTFAVLGQCMPVHWTALLGILFFSVHYQIFPVQGPDEGLGSFHQVLLPSLAMGWWIGGPIARLTRSAMLDILDSDYITMARMKGLAERTVVMKHALRNSVIPVLTFASVQFAYMLGGVVVVESIFSWPGLGRTMLQGIYNWDFPLVQAGVVVASIMIILTNFVVDIMYGVVDPRVRY